MTGWAISLLGIGCKRASVMWGHLLALFPRNTREQGKQLELDEWQKSRTSNKTMEQDETDLEFVGNIDNHISI